MQFSLIVDLLHRYAKYVHRKVTFILGVTTVPEVLDTSSKQRLTAAIRTKTSPIKPPAFHIQTPIRSNNLGIIRMRRTWIINRLLKMDTLCRYRTQTEITETFTHRINRRLKDSESPKRRNSIGHSSLTALVITVILSIKRAMSTRRILMTKGTPMYHMRAQCTTVQRKFNRIVGICEVSYWYKLIN